VKFLEVSVTQPYCHFLILGPCVATTESVRTNDNVTYSYPIGNCWTLTSAHCGPNPNYAVFTKKSGSKMAAKAYFGGHLVELTPNGNDVSVSINGRAMMLTDGKEETHTQNNVEIFK
jgi:hypothetical protein